MSDSQPADDAAVATSEPTPASPRDRRPKLWKNTFFWFAAILALLGFWGLFAGESVIRDPGQVREGGLVWIYLGGAVVMLVNGWMTHRSALQQFEDAEDED